MIRLEVLGRTELARSSGGGGPPLTAQPKRFALLTYLAAARPRGFQRRDSVLVLFWPESGEARARNALNQAVHALRSKLGEGVVLSRGREEIGVNGERLWCDVVAFDEEFAARRYADALDHYRGELLRGFHVTDAPGFERWVDTERSRLRRQAQAAATALADQREGEGNPVGAARWLERALEISSSNESLMRRLVSLLDRAGDRAGALRAYERFALDLRALGMEPSPETQELVSEIRGRRVIHGVPEEPSGSDDAKIRSLAVLPLDSLRDEPEQQVFAEGLTEAFIGELAQIDSLRVISRQSVLRFRDSEDPLDEIADALGVDAVIEGSVLRVEDRVRLSLQLIQVEPETHLWAEAFERDLADVLALQREVARSVAERVEGALAEGPGDKMTLPARIEPAAFDEFLLGAAPLVDGRVEEYPKAIEHLQKAVELDPTFGEPLAWITLAYANMTAGGFLSPDDAREPMVEAAHRALEIDDELGPAHLAHALTLQFFERDWEGAREAYRRASVERAATVFEPWKGWLILFLAGQGRFEEALSRARDEYQKDPLGPTSWIMGYSLHKARRFEDAIERFEVTLQTWPAFPFTMPFLAASYAFADRKEEAIRAARRSLEIAPDNQLFMAYSAATLARSGEADDARELSTRLRDRRSEGYVDPYNLALAAAGLGDTNEALDELDRLVEEGSTQSWAIPAEPFFDPLRSDPRFNAVLDRLDLPRLELVRSDSPLD